MASRTEGIALLSMYKDEDDDDDGNEESLHPARDPAADSTPPPSDKDADHETLASPVPPHPSPSLPPVSASLPEPSFHAPRPRRGGALAIVDYEHDEAAMSPETEEGEILSTGHDMMEFDLQDSDEHFEERTPPGTVRVLAPSPQQEPPQPSDFPERSESEIHMTMDFTGTETEVSQVEVADNISIEIVKDDPLNNFLPPPVTSMCPEDLQEKINRFLTYQKDGKSFNDVLRNKKDYRNPDFLQHAVRYQEIDQIGTCFSKDVFDPHGYDKSDYYDEIEADMKRETERKKSQKVDSISGSTQSATVAQTMKISGQNPGVLAVYAAASGFQSVSTTVDVIASRQNKKTKWDKVDADVKNLLQSGGHDYPSTVAGHAGHLSAANTGSGYNAFAQQKRREAEEKRSSERKFDKRS